MVDGYYEELARFQDPAQRAGWHRRVGQALRFEVALEAVGWSPGDAAARSVLDLGCGPGDLWDYLVATGRTPRRYLGLDRFAPSIALARQRFPDAEFRWGDLFSRSTPPEVLEGRFDLVVAIGTLVSGESLKRDAVRMRRLCRLLGRAFELSSGHAVVVLLKQEVLEDDPALAAERALGGARRGDLEYACHGLEGVLTTRLLEGFLTRERGLVVARRPLPERPPAERWALHERVLAGPWGRDLGRAEHAWLYLEAGAPDRARPLLGGADPPRGPLANLLRARLGLDVA